MKLILLLTFANLVFGEIDDPPRVTTPYGEIEGFLGETVGGKTYYAFEGVPYARAPVGKHRFKEPILPKPWTGIVKAKTMYICMQYNHLTPEGLNMIQGDEDCLYLNIYTPNLDPSSKLDVLVYIHGGAFMFNYGGIQGPQMLLDRNIVYVNLNYRLGPLGFLSTEDDVIPGNNGLKDQILALKWIKDNIQHFGGNPNSITLSGMSAGGASVHFHYLMPKSKGLFNKGISQSGVALNPWVLMENALEKARKLSDIVGCPAENSNEIIDCLRRKPARQIVEAVKHFQPWLYNPFSPFAVVWDSWASDPVLPDHPYNLLKNKKVQDLPWITSFVSSEGLYPAADFYSKDEYLYDLETKWNEIMPHVLHYNFSVDPGLRDSVSRKIRQYYLKDQPITRETYHKLVQLVGDRLFVVDIEKTGHLHSAAVKSPVYSYYFDYRGALSKTIYRAGTTDHIGVSHGDDTSYCFRTYMDTLSTEDDRKMSKLMIDMFISFMSTGKPNITSDWLPLSKKVTDPWRYLEISGPDSLKLTTKDILGHSDFWNSLPFKENEKIFETTKDEL